jgi:hypothetical protein
MSKVLLAATMAVLAMAVTGCGKDGGPDEELASVQLDLQVNPNFGGNSVIICGHRYGGAVVDTKYSCAVEFQCTCFNFDSQGKLYHEIKDLCPSNNVP